MLKLNEEMVKLRDDVRCKDEQLEALTNKLVEKGAQNQKLTEKLVEMKNHQLTSHYLN